MARPALVVPFRRQLSRRDVVAAAFAATAGAPAALREDEGWAARVAKAAADVGPVFAAFIEYLATRIDLLPAADCRAFEQVRLSAHPWPVDRVARLLAEEIGDDEIHDLANEPILRTAVSQTHRGHLRTGEAVLVEVVSVDRTELDGDLELLPLMRHAVRGRLADAMLQSAIADFRPRFEEHCDCRRRLPLAAYAAQLVCSGGRLRATIPRPELTSRRVLVCELPPEPLAGDEESRPPWHRGDPQLAIIEAWLRQVATGSVFCVPSAALVRTHDVVAVGAYARMPEAAVPHVLDYLLALAGHLPDRAWSALAHQLIPAAGAAPAEDVAREFRSLVPFRDDRTCDSGSELADHAFLQWRIASRHGWLPSPHLVPFYQGLFAMLSAVRGGSAGDRFATAVRGLRFESAVRQADEWAGGFDMSTTVERQMLLLMQLPQKLDRLLSVAADGSVHVHLASDERSAPRRARATATLALVLVAAAAIVLAGAAAPLDLMSPESRQAFALLVAGGLFVWTVGRVL